MIHERISLVGSEDTVYLDTYVSICKDTPPSDAMLVIPGGGYHHVCIDREGESVALAYVARGISAFTLNYDVTPKHKNAPLLDAARAMAYIKDNAEKYHINPNRVFVVGFSAGAHLAGTLSTMHKRAERLLGLAENYLRPAGTVYSYPVVTAMCETHTGSFENLMGKSFAELSEEEKREFSIELCVNEQTPPAFIWHTAEDKGVVPYGSLRLAEAYVRSGVAVEMHLYPYGAHGLALSMPHTSLGREDYVQPKAVKWLDESCEWIKSLHNT